MTDEIYRVTGLDIEIDQIIENISSEESNIYFFDKDLSEKPENEKDVILAWIDTGIKVNGNEPLMISLLKRSDYFSGYYVGTPSYLVNGMCRKTLYSEKKLRSNLLKFCHRYREEHAERICKVETEVKDRSEGYCEKTIFIKNEEVLSNVTEGKEISIQKLKSCTWRCKAEDEIDFTKSYCMCGLWTGAFRCPGGRTDHRLYGGNLVAGQTEERAGM